MCQNQRQLHRIINRALKRACPAVLDWSQSSKQYHSQNDVGAVTSLSKHWGAVSFIP